MLIPKNAKKSLLSILFYVTVHDLVLSYNIIFQFMQIVPFWASKTGWSLYFERLLNFISKVNVMQTFWRLVHKTEMTIFSKLYENTYRYTYARKSQFYYKHKITLGTASFLKEPKNEYCFMFIPTFSKTEVLVLCNPKSKYQNSIHHIWAKLSWAISSRMNIPEISQKFGLLYFEYSSKMCWIFKKKIFLKKFGQTEFSVDPELQLACKYKYIIEKSINQLLQLL